MILNLIFVGLGGALGVFLRALCIDYLSPRLPKSLPYPTLLINIVACFLIGIAAALVSTQVAALCLCMGVLGGFSTLSTMMFEAVTYFTEGKHARCFGYLGLSFASCIIASAAGMLLVGTI